MVSKPIIAFCSLLMLGSVAQAAEPIQRQRPGVDPNDNSAAAARDVYNSGALSRPASGLPRETISIPDRWRLIETLGIVKDDFYDPYNQNTYKGDRPIHDDWFLSLTAISDTVVELRQLPTPVGPQSTESSGSNDLIGDSEQTIFAENLILSAVYYKGDTVFRPPDYEFRFIPVIN